MPDINIHINISLLVSHIGSGFYDTFQPVISWRSEGSCSIEQIPFFVVRIKVPDLGHDIIARSPS